MYLEKESDVATVIDYVDGRHMHGRQLRAKTSLVSPEKDTSNK